jgi:uncharacterized lipoprotein YmbA
MTSKRLALSALLVAAALAGCGSSPKVNFYSLGPDAASMRTDAKHAYTVAIGAVTVPDDVDRPQIVTRTGANRLAINEFERWAGPLQGQIARTIADNLTPLLPGAGVLVYPQGSGTGVDYRVLVEVQRFDSAPGDAATVEILWQIRPAKGAPASGRSAVREPVQGAGYDALVAAHSRALAAVSRDIAKAIQAGR